MSRFEDFLEHINVLATDEGWQTYQPHGNNVPQNKLLLVKRYENGKFVGMVLARYDGRIFYDPNLPSPSPVVIGVGEWFVLKHHHT